jgi:hypothetical protein
MCILRSYLSGISVLAQGLSHRTPLLPPLQRISQSRAGSSDIKNVSNIGQAYHQSKCGKQLLTLIG